MSYSIFCPYCERQYTIEDNLLSNNLLCECESKFFYDKSLPRMLFVNTDDGVLRFPVFRIKKLISNGEIPPNLKIFSTDKRNWKSFTEIYDAAALKAVIVKNPFIDETLKETVDSSIIPLPRQTTIPRSIRLKILLILIPNFIIYYWLLGFTYTHFVPGSIQELFTYRSFANKVNACASWLQDALPAGLSKLLPGRIFETSDNNFKIPDTVQTEQKEKS